MDDPQNPTVIQAARPVETLDVIEQKSAETIVVKHPPQWVRQGEGLNLEEKREVAKLDQQ